MPFGCSLPLALLEQLDNERGQVPRSQHIELLIRKARSMKDEMADHGLDLSHTQKTDS